MPIRRTYGQTAIPRLAQKAGQATATMRGIELDQRLAEQAFQRSQMREQNRLREQRQLLDAELQARRQRAQQRARRSPAGQFTRGRGEQRTRPLTNQLREAIEKERERQGEAFSSPFRAAEAPQPSAEIRGEDRTVRFGAAAGPDERLTVEDGGRRVADREAGAVERRERVESPKTASKRAFLQAAGGGQLSAQQQQALNELVQNPDVDLSDFRMAVSRAVDQGKDDGGSGLQGLSPHTQHQYRADAINREIEQLQEQYAVSPLELQMSKGEFIRKLAENKDASYVPGMGGSEEARMEMARKEDADRIAAFERLKQLLQERQQILGTGGGQSQSVEQGNDPLGIR